MRNALAILALLVLLCGCADGVYLVERYERWTAVAISTERAVTVSHPVHVGQRLRLYVRRSWVPVEVSRIYGDMIELKAADGGSLDLQPGDSGSPVALMVGRRR